MRILINQTTRMGDMIQTTPLIRQLRRAHPDAHIAVIVRTLGKVIAERNPDIDEIIIYEEDPLFLDLRANDSNRLLSAYRRADEIVSRLKAGRYDILYNTTHSLASAMLARLAEIPSVAGADLTEDWHYILRGRWPNYFFTSVFSRDYNDLNLCDIVRNFAPDAPPCRELVFETTAEDEAYVDGLFAEQGIGKDRPIVCMQLGASEVNKRWAEERFAEVARTLAAEHNARIILLGVAGEAAFGEQFEIHAPGLALHLFGKTTISQAAALLKRAALLVSNDTGTMHLAAAQNCPTVLVSIGHVHFRETGPYGAGHIAIEVRRAALGRSDFVPGSEDDRERITAEHAALAARIVLGGGVRDQIDDTEKLQQVELHYSAFARDGCLEFYPLIRRAMTTRDIVRIAYRAMWLEHLGGAAGLEAERTSVEKCLACYLGPNAEEATEITGQVSAAFDDLARIARRGIAATEELLAALRHGSQLPKARQLVTHLMALDEEARVHAEIHPPCKPLVLMARFERDNLEGADVMRLAETTLRIYQDCAARADLMRVKLALIDEVWLHLVASLPSPPNA